MAAAMVASNSSLSSRVSLISLDPAVASQITATSRTTTAPAASQYGSSPRKSTKTPKTEVSRRHVRNVSAPSVTGKRPPVSLRRVKDSTEVLRQRSIQSSAPKTKQSLQAIPDNHQGRHFTVGNVGTGGILYLTPSAHRNVNGSPHPSSSPDHIPSTAPALLGTGEQRVPSQEKPSSSRSVSPPRPQPATAKRIPKPPQRPQALSSHGRSLSFSTVEEHRQSLLAPQSRTVRIVINRPDAERPRTSQDHKGEPEHELQPTLEVPIPHYRIGTFRLSSNGTPMLRGSSYTRASLTPSDVTPTPAIMQAEGYFGGPPPASLRAFARLEAKDAGAAHTGFLAPVKPSLSQNMSAKASSLPPNVQPQVFEDLSGMYNDPSVVRYCQNVREITAATPARIIAQISSDSFMDYELVSDFFLTFRSYMSTYEVLDLLLARLRWAIGRLEDSGRIIRVRTFAALRHWILNYFMDDFFSNRRLRVRFCTEVNKLYADVKASPVNGFSDLKLLRDLKRCWNGRCSLCWDPEDFDLDGDQDEDIHPGGDVEDEGTPMLKASAQLAQARSESPQTPILRGPTHSWFEAEPIVRPSHDRQESEQSAPLSDISLQAGSCFGPKNIRRAGAGSDVGFAKARHPVSVQLRRKNAPSNLEVVTNPSSAPRSLGHKKGASSIDSNREPTPRQIQLEPEPTTIIVDEESIIRGLLYSPSAPFVQIIPSHSTQSLDRTDTLRSGTRRDQSGTPASAQPVARNIFGSLRKALGNKHSHMDVALFTVTQPAQETPGRGHTAQTALNLSKSHDELRNKTNLGLPRKGEMRIDLLAAAVCQNYDTKFSSKHRITYGALYATNPALQPDAMAEGELKLPQAPSHGTRQSGSILIVDDTRPGLPSMSGALTGLEKDFNHPHAPRLLVPGGYDQEIRKESFDAVATQRSSNVLPHDIDLPPARGSDDTMDRVMIDLAVPLEAAEDDDNVTNPAGRTQSLATASSRTVKEDLNHFVPRRLGVDNSITGKDSEDDDDPTDDSDTELKLPVQTLRRRPGGDLRRAENVQELDHVLHHASLDTASAISESPHESLLIMKTDTTPAVPPARGPPAPKAVSMINTHSSQHLRPSFEVAVAGFSAIPDDDDGGLEATLMKLEGRYEKSSPPMEQHPLDATSRRRSLPELSRISQAQLSESTAELRERSIAHFQTTVDEVLSEKSDDEPVTPSLAVANVQIPSSRRSSIYGLPTESVADSEESYGSLPLLKREAGHGSTAVVPPQKSPVELPLVAPGYFPQDPPQLFHLPKGPPPSGNKQRNSIPRPGTGNESAQSFLLDEDENLSDLSSDISVDIINYSEVPGRSMSPMLAAPGTAISGLEIPAHPLTYASVVNLRLSIPPEKLSDPISHGKLAFATQQSAERQDSATTQPLARLPTGPAHMPFILACDSQILAQQMTLVEKSALCEVEWSDLVEMRWDSKNADVSDWVECLADGSIRGIDLVSTRFNLVVKWALSEIVLTQDVEERARVITKYIHVAAHCRRLHNYATMLQLTLALTSADCTRLSKTWALVSGPDKSLLKHMETLAQPLRNFHDLRMEMESAELSDGCIPFLGLYIRDLTYNSQKPSHLPGPRGSESLVNFERYRSTAVIVKGLLRLIDASSRYNFEPVPGIIERCLWLATLGDNRIRNASKALE